MNRQTEVAISAAVLAAGLTILSVVAILAFEGGMIADETGTVGSSTPVRDALWVIGPLLIVAGAVWLPIALRRRSRALV